MAEEMQETEGTWTGLKKTIVGTLATVVTAGGAWIGTTLFGGGSDNAAPAPAPAPVINITNSNQQAQQASGGGKTVIIKEKASSEKPVEKKEEKKKDEWTKEEPKW
jgi:hypothetical protein